MHQHNQGKLILAAAAQRPYIWQQRQHGDRLAHLPRTASRQLPRISTCATLLRRGAETEPAYISPDQERFLNASIARPRTPA